MDSKLSKEIVSIGKIPYPSPFLPRTVKISNSNLNAFPTIRIRQYYLKKLIGNSAEEPSNKEAYKSISKPLKIKKLYKTMYNAQISSYFDPFVNESIKNCKVLSSCAFEVIDQEEILLKRMMLYLRKLPSRITAIKAFGDLKTLKSNKPIYDIARSVRRFPKLKCFERGYLKHTSREMTYVEKEFSIYSQTTSRLKKLTKMIFRISDTEKSAFARMIRRGTAEYPRIHELKLDPSKKPKPFKFRDETFVGRLEEIKSLYDFSIFPNLKKLSIGEDYFLNPLGSFVVDGFKALKSLKALKIIISRRPPGMNYFFNALLELPLLEKFSLSISSLRDNDWPLFQQFVNDQKDLVKFCFIIINQHPPTPHDSQQCICLKTTLQSLNNKPFLKSLNLSLPFFPLEVLSKGLENISMDNQLHTLKLQAFDDKKFSQEQPKKCVEALNQFLKNRQESIKTLHIALIALEDEIVTEIVETISELTQLKELRLEFHPINPTEKKELYRFVCQISQLDEKKDWDPSLDKHIGKLKNLESLTFKSGMIGIFPPGPVDWLSDFFLVLKRLKRLKSLTVDIEHTSLREEDSLIVYALQKLKKIKKISLNLRDFPMSNPKFNFKAEAVAKEINQKKAMESNYFF